jgi:hypothetical protein
MLEEAGQWFLCSHIVKIVEQLYPSMILLIASNREIMWKL